MKKKNDICQDAEVELRLQFEAKVILEKVVGRNICYLPEWD
ncbi:hypothetical protein [Salinimicrobium sp. TH3]|nr:hypothetical protein [Salinimicrobium sp. TH3]MCY2688579.1 hypothetical protein [Salinimicrobium sp. TH3]